MTRTNNKYTKDLLQQAVNRSVSWSGVCREVGITPASGAQTHLKRVAIRLEVDFSHFKGQAWSRGQTFDKRPVSVYLVEHSSAKSSDLREKLIREGLKEAKCERCGLVDWQGLPPPLELDHINRMHDDCRIENLQILCANCHTVKTREDRIKPL